MSIKDRLRDLSPPVVWRNASRLKMALRNGGRQFKDVVGEERSADYYDERFRLHAEWRSHYTRSHYYPVWTVLVDRIRRAGATSVLDIGCGPGQLAEALRDAGTERYLGLDFSTARVEHARKVCPEFDFVVADVFKTDLLETRDYDLVLTAEFLEHVNEDLLVLNRIRDGVRVLATVPNFGGSAHVRYFQTVDEVHERYGGCLEDLSVVRQPASPDNLAFYIMEGIARTRH